MMTEQNQTQHEIEIIEGRVVTPLEMFQSGRIHPFNGGKMYHIRIDEEGNIQGYRDADFDVRDLLAGRATLKVNGACGFLLWRDGEGWVLYERNDTRGKAPPAGSFPIPDGFGRAVYDSTEDDRGHHTYWMRPCVDPKLTAAIAEQVANMVGEGILPRTPAEIGGRTWLTVEIIGRKHNGNKDIEADHGVYFHGTQELRFIRDGHEICAKEISGREWQSLARRYSIEGVVFVDDAGRMAKLRFDQCNGDSNAEKCAYDRLVTAKKTGQPPIIRAKVWGFTPPPPPAREDDIIRGTGELKIQ